MATRKKTSTNGESSNVDTTTKPSERQNRSAAHLAGMEAAATNPGKSSGKLITLPPIKIAHIDFWIDGDSPLICHNWSEKARKQILDKQMQQNMESLGPKDPDDDYLRSLYPMADGGCGFPAIAFKDAAVSACTSLGKSVITKTAARQAFHVETDDGRLVKIHGKHHKAEDMVRINRGGTDVRFRAEFPKWSVHLSIRYNAGVMSAEQIINMMNIAGFAVGVGDWRPERDGSNGMFHVRGGAQ